MNVPVPAINDFERFLNLWRGLYVLDDAFYHKAISELTLDVDPKIACSFLIRFLELWGVEEASTRISPVELSQRISNLKPKLAKMDISILDGKFNKMKDEIVEAFREICSVKNVGPTSASKILHLLRPKLFVMWDNNIAKRFGVRMSPKGYLDFLEKCRDVLEGILNEYRRSGISDPESYLLNKYGKPLTKLLDEYNWLSTRRWISSTTPCLMQFIRGQGTLGAPSQPGSRRKSI
ncbi:MAG: hypothetical protein QXI60_10230 [Thermofilaceae archaeon]